MTLDRWGVYDAAMSSRTLLANGDFGLGNLEHLDDEMAVLDGNYPHQPFSPAGKPGVSFTNWTFAMFFQVYICKVLFLYCLRKATAHLQRCRPVIIL